MNDFQTPESTCDFMVGMIPDGVVNVLEPTPGEGNLVKSLCDKGYQVTAPDDFWEIKGNWDCIVMNPPFTPMMLGYDILYRCMEMTDKIVALMPWLTIINSEKRTKEIVSFGLKSIAHLPRNVFPGSRVQTCILNMNRSHSGFTKISFEEFPS